MNKGLLIVISSPSGGGKGTILKELFKSHENLKMSVSATTRAPRPGEENGVHYYFISKEEFQKNIDEEVSVPQEIFDYPDYMPLVTINEVDEQLPEDFKGQTGQIPLVGIKIEILRHQDKKMVSEVIVERFDYEGASL